MPWTYSQRTGLLTRGSVTLHGAYSGHDVGRNNPGLQRLPSVGPIPQGTYLVGLPHHSSTVGRYAMSLTPQSGTNTFGRTALMLHGDNPAHPGESSTGCIVAPLVVRQHIWASGDHLINVVP